MSKALSTINTVLKVGPSGGALTKVTPIKTYPDLFGIPDTIEVTDLDDDQVKTIPGVRSSDSLEFSANYLHTTFDALKDLEDTDLDFEIDFGPNGSDGKFTWTGRLSVSISGGDVNSARDMTITVFPDSDITDETVSVTPSITVSPTTASIAVGATSSITKTVNPSGSTVAWRSSDTSVATVNASGVITGVAAGTCVVYASMEYGANRYQASVAVTVTGE